VKEHHRADELRTLDEAEVEAVSGGKKFDFGILGVLKINGKCGSWTTEYADGTSIVAYCEAP
jgi:hypothetical protein